MDLQHIIHRYRDRFLLRYGHTLNADQWSALNAITGCRQGQYGSLLLSCTACSQTTELPRSCGHRACNQCQHHSTQAWLEHQQQKQLPVSYYLATFTLPSELRGLALSHPRDVYTRLIQCAVSTLKTFGLNKQGFEAELGLCVVLHTHTRRLNYHPHVHVVIPGGGIHRARRQWRKIKGDYLFNGKALAAVFRGKLLHALAQAGLAPAHTPQKWVVQCQKAGRGKETLQYLSRYLYRGVISNANLLEDDGDRITFRYRDSKSHDWKTRTLPGEAFIRLILLHVLPKGFRRVRDYGFLHGNAQQLLRIVQWVFRVAVPHQAMRPKARLCCRQCGSPVMVCFQQTRLNPG